MTRERIEDIREVVLPFVKKRLLETNYENLGEPDAEMFAKDFDEILNLAIKALEQDTVSKESYDHEYFLRRKMEAEIDHLRRYISKLETQIVEQEPTTKNNQAVDCISRTYLYNRIKGIDHDEDYECDEYGGSRITYHTCDWDEVLREIEDAPSATPQDPRWIPVSERLPEKNVWVLVTFKMANGENSVDIKRINQWNGQWEDEIDIAYNKNIIAWMPLPKAYREVEE